MSPWAAVLQNLLICSTEDKYGVICLAGDCLSCILLLRKVIQCSVFGQNAFCCAAIERHWGVPLLPTFKGNRVCIHPNADVTWPDGCSTIMSDDTSICACKCLNKQC